MSCIAANYQMSSFSLSTRQRVKPYRGKSHLLGVTSSSHSKSLPVWVLVLALSFLLSDPVTHLFSLSCFLYLSTIVIKILWVYHMPSILLGASKKSLNKINSKAVALVEHTASRAR